MRSGYLFEHLVLACTIVLMIERSWSYQIDHLLEILILTLKNFIRTPVLRYLGICYVSYIWSVWAIPTYRVYRLYDTYNIGGIIIRDL